MNKELKEQARKEFIDVFTNKKNEWLSVASPLDVTHFIDSLIDKTVQMTEERIVGEVSNSKFADLIHFYQSNRGSGHTYASVKGVENVEGAYLLVVDEHQKQNTGLPINKQISMNGREIMLGGRRSAVVPDNYTLQEMYRQLISLITNNSDINNDKE